MVMMINIKEILRKTIKQKRRTEIRTVLVRKRFQAALERFTDRTYSHQIFKSSKNILNIVL